MTAVTLPSGRRYFVQPGGPTLVLFLHGTGGTAEWAVDEANIGEFAANIGWTLVAPQALCPNPSKPPKFLTNPPRWNDGSDAPVPELVSTADDVSYLCDVLADAGADARRVVVAGFSNGAGMAFRFAAERAELVSVLVAVAGYCWVPAKPSRPVPTLYIVGERDPLIPPRGGDVRLPWGNRLVQRPPMARTLAAWATAIGCSPEPTVDASTPLPTDIYPGPVPMRAVTVPGLGHHWPGGKGQLNPRIGGAAGGAANANEMIAAFVTDVQAAASVGGASDGFGIA